MCKTSFVGTCEFTLPRANFGSRWTASNREEHFAHAFTKAYDSKYAWIHSGSSKMHRLFAHEVPVNGFGIADLVTVSWDTKSVSPVLGESGTLDDLLALQSTVRAFEVKLSDWRRGLMQAHRYRFFSDAAILVIPDSKLPLAKKSLPTFRSLNVGLWGYNEISKAITKVLTPRPKRPTPNGHRAKAVERAYRAATQGLPSP